MIIRKATDKDLDVIQSIILQAQVAMANLGIDQWQNGYPDPGVLKRDILKNRSYLLEESDSVYATFVLTYDGERNYASIAGAWITEGRYATLHRMAVHPLEKGKNMAGKILEWVESDCRAKGVHSIRVDTHADNLPMRRVIEKFGFIYCGIITVEDDSPRLAYEKVV